MRSTSQDVPTYKDKHLRKQTSENFQMERKKNDFSKQHSTQSLNENDIQIESFSQSSHK